MFVCWREGCVVSLRTLAEGAPEVVLAIVVSDCGVCGEKGSPQHKMIVPLPQLRIPEIHHRPVSLPKYHKQGMPRKKVSKEGSFFVQGNFF